MKDTVIATGLLVMANSGSDSEESRKIEGKTSHGEQRARETQEGDTNRQVGDVNRIVREGRHFRDTETGYDVYVRGDKVAIVDPLNSRITLPSFAASNTRRRFFSVSPMYLLTIEDKSMR